MTEQATIYCIKTGETIHYIGKTLSETNTEGGINRSDLKYPYHNASIREVFMNDNGVSVEPIKFVPISEWYDEKLLEVVEKHKQNHPLLNAQWMLDGKRGYWEGTGGFWEGKTRDAHTLKRLSESKYRGVVQYDLNGNLVKIWESRKEAATEVFGDYRVVNGSAASSLYSLVTNANPKNRLKHGSYWFSRDEFNVVPTRISIPIMYWKYKKNKKPQTGHTHHKQFTVEYYIDSKHQLTFNNVKHAGHVLWIHYSFVRKICTGTRGSSKYDLRYGPKKLQQINMSYGEE